MHSILTALLGTLVLVASPTAPAVSPMSPSDDERDLEKALIATFHDEWKGNDPEQLALAITHLSDGSRAMEDRGADKTISRLLVKGTREDSLVVQAAAIEALAWGRDIDTVLDACEEVLEELHSQVARRATRPDSESRAYLHAALAVYEQTCEVLASHVDDRSVDILEARLRLLRRDNYVDLTSAYLSGPLSNALLQLRSRDAVYAVVKQTQAFVGGWNAQPAAHVFHRELSQLALSLDLEPPLFSGRFDVTWGDWFREHDDRFPKKLGKLKEPTEPPTAPLRAPGARAPGLRRGPR